MVEDCAVGYGGCLDRFSYDCDFVMVSECAGGIEGGEQGVHVVFGLDCRTDDVCPLAIGLHPGRILPFEG